MYVCHIALPGAIEVTWNSLVNTRVRGRKLTTTTHSAVSWVLTQESALGNSHQTQGILAGGKHVERVTDNRGHDVGKTLINIIVQAGGIRATKMVKKKKKKKAHSIYILQTFTRSFWAFLFLWWNTMPISKLGRKGFIWLTLPSYSSSLQEVRAGTQIGQ